VPLELNERDREIIRLVHRHRFLRSHQIVALIGKSPQPILRRLQLLYHHGYLERPRAQLDYYHRGGSRSIVYGVGSKGTAILKGELGEDSSLRWGEKNRAAGRMFLEHALLVSEVMVAIELACRNNPNVRFVPGEELLPESNLNGHRYFQWKVQMTNNVKLGVVPDRVFALEFSNTSGELERAYFFLEADRGTMPVRRKHLTQTSFYRKLLAYEATWSQSIHRRRFGFHRFRVLTVTTIAGRVTSLVEACSQLKRGHGLFLFADRGILQSPNILSAIWSSGNKDEIDVRLTG